jgi:hypothetical protein
MSSPYANIERMAGFPPQYTPSRFFSKYSSAFLPPVYRDIAHKLSSKKVNFLNMWAWESENIRQELKFDERLGDIQHYDTREHSHPGISYRMSEVYRSAFLRTLAWFHMAGDLSDNAFRELSTMTVPIDLSLWEISAQSAPKWWPRFTRSRPGPNDAENILQASWSEIRKLVDINVDEQGKSPRLILAAQGPLFEEELREDDNVSLNFRLMAFGYEVLGPEPSRPQEIERLIFSSCGRPKPDSLHSLSVLDALRHNSMLYSAFSWRSETSLKVTALVSRLEPSPINTWQWFRSFGRPLSLSQFFGLPGSMVAINASSWSYCSQDKEVASFYDWRSGALEQHSRIMFPRHGNVAEADSDWLSERLDEAGLKLGYVLRIDLKLQKKSYDEVKDHSHTELIGVSRLISDSTL